MASHSPSSYLESLFGLEGKTVLITGGTRGIGRGLSVALASAGANIVFLARNPMDPTVLSTVSEAESLGVRALIFTCDLADRSSVLSCIPLICQDNKIEIDVLVHCEGIQHRAPAEDFPAEMWDEILNINLTAGFLLSKDLGKWWLDHSLKGWGTGDAPPGERGLMKKIIMIASVTTTASSVQIPAYASSKGAMASLTRALSNEWMGKGINVNAIAPGYFETALTSGIREDGEKERHLFDRIPAGRWGDPSQDLNGTVIHLASRSSDFIGGAMFTVDGGFTAR